MAALISWALFSPLLHAQQVVYTEPVRIKHSAPGFRATGELKARAISTLSASDAAKLAQMLVTEGDLVKQGDVLARLDQTRVALEIQQKEYEVANLQAAVEQTKVDVAHTQIDYEAALKIQRKGNTISKQEVRNVRVKLDTARISHTAAVQALKASQSALQLLQTKRSDAVIRAPYAAVVSEKHADVGEWLDVGDAIVTLIQRDRMDAWLEIPERLAESLMLSQMQPATVTVNALTLLSERIRPVGQVYANSRTFYVIAPLADNTEGLLNGMSVTGWVPVGEPQDYLFVHKDSIIQREGSTSVFTVKPVLDPDAGNRNDTALPIPVTVLFYEGDYVAVDTGGALAANDLVVVEGNQRLASGTIVEAIQVAAAEQDQINSSVAWGE